MRTAPPDVVSAVKALRDELMSCSDVNDAVAFVSDQFDIKPEVLRIRFERQYNCLPEAMRASALRKASSIKPNVPNAFIARQKAVSADRGRENNPTSNHISGINSLPSPSPSTFGLPPSFDLKRFEEESSAVDRKIQILSVFGLALVIALISLLSAHPILYSIGAVFVGFPVCHAVVALALRRYNEQSAYIIGLRAPAFAYRVALKEWFVTQTECGIEYWRALRGVGFEEAVQQFFGRRGFQASLTTTTGDGGVDVILNGSGRTYWCQCKGYATKVSVAPIREIAGVCSKSRAIPVVFAVNGFTQPALLQANALGVICLDGPDFCRLAPLKALTALKHH